MRWSGVLFIESFSLISCFPATMRFCISSTAFSLAALCMGNIFRQQLDVLHRIFFTFARILLDSMYPTPSHPSDLSHQVKCVCSMYYEFMFHVIPHHDRTWWCDRDLRLLIFWTFVRGVLVRASDISFEYHGTFLQFQIHSPRWRVCPGAREKTNGNE